MAKYLKLKDFELKDGNHFIAMEYYNLILNRTFLVLILDDYLLGLKVNGLICAEGGGDPLSKSIINSMAIQNDLENPYSYMKSKYLRRIVSLSVFGDKILEIESSNFKINRGKIKSVVYDKGKKWGMGYYPHDGKVYVKTYDGKKKEFIILGSQSGEEIKNWIEKK